jgi:hypothetical protein
VFSILCIYEVGVLPKLWLYFEPSSNRYFGIFFPAFQVLHSLSKPFCSSAILPRPAVTVQTP